MAFETMQKLRWGLKVPSSLRSQWPLLLSAEECGIISIPTTCKLECVKCLRASTPPFNILKSFSKQQCLYWSLKLWLRQSCGTEVNSACSKRIINADFFFDDLRLFYVTLSYFLVKNIRRANSFGENLRVCRKGK